jgi:two-component sensor histidine kinase
MKRYSLARRLVVILTAIGVMAALLVPFAGVLNEYYVAQRLVADQVRAVETSTLPVLAHLVWTVNDAQTEQLLRGIVAQPTVTAAALEREGATTMRITSELWDPGGDSSMSWPVEYSRDHTLYTLGELQMWVRSPWAMAWSMEPLGLGLLAGFAAASLLSAGIAAIIRTTVTAPLVRLASDVRALTPTGTPPAHWNSTIEADRGEETYQIRVALTRAINARRETEQRLATSLAEKEVLLQEVHHRVKNNLQIISSMLSLQHGTVADPNAQAALEDSRHRVMSMATVHELLYQGSSAHTVQLNQYLHNLAAALHAPTRNDVTITVDAPETPVSVDTAIPMGLVVTELVTNAVKHAFSREHPGTITIHAGPEQHESLRISVGDDGIGLPQDWSMDGTDSLGMRIVSALTSQLGTELTIETGSGTRFSFVVPSYSIESDLTTSGSAREDESARRISDSPRRASPE